MPVGVKITGLQKLQRANLEAIRALKPRHALGVALKRGLAMIHRLSVVFTPHDTGALRQSHRMKIDTRQVIGRVSIDRTARNRRGQLTHEYGYHLHQQGHRPGLVSGWRDFYAHVYNTYGQRILERMAAIIKKALP